MKIAIVGSMNFAKEMLNIKKKLEEQKHIVIVPKNIEMHANNSIKIENIKEKIEENLIRHYFEEIKNWDSILVLNKDKNNIKNYIGGNCLIEMAFAHVLNKKIFLLNSIPEMTYKDEIEAMQPIILNNNLEKVK
jgi:predicted RNA-binding protein with PUA domain